MKAISNAVFLQWASEGGLAPDARFSQSRPQLVFVACPDSWCGWEAPRAPGEPAAFVAAGIRALSADGPYRVRIRGGGPFSIGTPDSDRERAIQSALVAANVPLEAEGAIEFDKAEWSALLEVAVAFFSFGYRVETDLEIIALDRSACLLFGHDGALAVQFCSDARQSSFIAAMRTAGYAVAGSGDDSG